MWPIWCSKLEYSAHCFDPAFPRWRCSVMFGDESLMIVLAAAPGRTKDDLNCVSGFQIFQMSSHKNMEDWHNWWIFWKGKNNKSWHFCCTKHAQSACTFATRIQKGHGIHDPKKPLPKKPPPSDWLAATLSCNPLDRTSWVKASARKPPFSHSWYDYWWVVDLPLWKIYKNMT